MWVFEGLQSLIKSNSDNGENKEKPTGRWTWYVSLKQVPVILMGTQCRKWVYGTGQYPNYKDKAVGQGRA